MRLPQSQDIDLLAAVAHNEHIPGHRDNGGIVGILGMIAAQLIPAGGDVPAKTDLHRVLRPGNQPALGSAAPVIGRFDLFAVFKLLLEHAQLVADGIARGLKSQSGHTVHIAGGETAQAAVAQTCIRLPLKNIGGIMAHVLQCTGYRLGNAQVEGILHQAAAHEKLHGHIVYLFFRAGRVLRCEKAAHDLPDHDGRRLKDLIVGGVLPGDAKMGAEFILYGAANLIA